MSPTLAQHRADSPYTVDGHGLRLRRPDEPAPALEYLPCDREEAERRVDEVLAGASGTYRSMHREKMIRAEARFVRFERERREALAMAIAYAEAAE